MSAVFTIPLNKPFLTGNEEKYISDAMHSLKLCGDGPYTKKCQELIETRFHAKKVLLTPSCTHALELCSLLLDLKEGDEVIVPSFTFVSTVNAFMLRGAKPIFVDIKEDTKNINEGLVEEKITKKTKAIYLVHYAGIACDMKSFLAISKKYNIPIIEDAALGFDAKYKEKYLGTFGTFGCYSFHDTKNLTCGEGGALVINDERFIEHAEILREKGTNRKQFLQGSVDKYTWVGIGSSYLLSDIQAAFLLAQLEAVDQITSIRKKIHETYYESLKDLEKKGRILLPKIPEDCCSNYHLFYLLLKDQRKRNSFIQFLKKQNITSAFHYIPLHSSPIGFSLGYKEGDLPITEDVSQRLVRLPFYTSMTSEEQQKVITVIREFFNRGYDE